MFVQVIHGKTADAKTLQGLAARWVAELSPDATGWLSSTSGVTADGDVIVVACFASAEAARRNSNRPEQGAWWAKVEKCFTQRPTFYDVDDPVVVRGGISANAGFVQAMLGRVSDPARVRELTHNLAALDPAMRPDLLGGVVGIGNDGRFAQAFYFSSEAEARVGEQSEVPAEMAESFAEEQQLITEINYYDLTKPAIYAAG
jgi:hypothetical protein